MAIHTLEVTGKTAITTADKITTSLVDTLGGIGNAFDKAGQEILTGGQALLTSIPIPASVNGVADPENGDGIKKGRGRGGGIQTSTWTWAGEGTDWRGGEVGTPGGADYAFGGARPMKLITPR